MKPIPFNRYVVFGLLAGAGFGWDLWTKHAVFERLGWPHAATPWRQLVGEQAVQFQFHTSFNHGALWGMGQGFAWAFATLSILATAAILWWLFVRGAAASLWLTSSLGFVTAGTLGNLWDRLGLHGCRIDGAPVLAVRDFLYFRFGTFDWPVFNFADVFLVTGAILLVVQSFFLEHTLPGRTVSAECAAGPDEEAGAANPSGPSDAPAACNDLPTFRETAA